MCVSVCLFATVETVPSQRKFSMSLCCFSHDVSLGNVTVAGQPVLWEEMERNGVRLSQSPFPNNTYMYLFQMPFSHPLIHLKVIYDIHWFASLFIDILIRNASLPLCWFSIWETGLGGILFMGSSLSFCLLMERSTTILLLLRQNCRM